MPSLVWLVPLLLLLAGHGCTKQTTHTEMDAVGCMVECEWCVGLMSQCAEELRTRDYDRKTQIKPAKSAPATGVITITPSAQTREIEIQRK